MPDYLTDARIKKVPFTKFKSFLQEKGAPKADLFAASTKFALVAVAEKHSIKLEPRRRNQRRRQSQHLSRLQPKCLRAQAPHPILSTVPAENHSYEPWTGSIHLRHTAYIPDIYGFRSTVGKCGRLGHVCRLFRSARLDPCYRHCVCRGRLRQKN